MKTGFLSTGRRDAPHTEDFQVALPPTEEGLNLLPFRTLYLVRPPRPLLGAGLAIRFLLLELDRGAGRDRHRGRRRCSALEDVIPKVRWKGFSWIKDKKVCTNERETKREVRKEAKAARRKTTGLVRRAIRTGFSVPERLHSNNRSRVTLMLERGQNGMVVSRECRKRRGRACAGREGWMHLEDQGQLVAHPDGRTLSSHQVVKRALFTHDLGFLPIDQRSGRGG